MSTPPRAPPGWEVPPAAKRVKLGPSSDPRAKTVALSLLSVVVLCTAAFIASDDSDDDALPSADHADIAAFVFAICNGMGWLHALPRTFPNRRSFLENKLNPNTSPQGFYDSFRCSREAFLKMYDAVRRSKAWQHIAKRRRRNSGIKERDLFGAVLYKLQHAMTYREIEVMPVA